MDSIIFFYFASGHMKQKENCTNLHILFGAVGLQTQKRTK